MEGYHVITCESLDAVITVPIPADCKPLSCSILTKGGTTGLLASFYDPEAHTWVVKHAPVDIGFAKVTVRVLTLIDPTDMYEVYVTVTSAENGAGVDELYELRRRSFEYCTAREPRPEDGPDGPARSWPPAGLERPKYPRDLVCLNAPLPVLSGYVLCGGGFVSDYPVHFTGPSMPILTDRFYDRVMGDDAAFFAAVAAQREDGDGIRGVADPFLVYDMLKPDEKSGSNGKAEATTGIEYSAWAVTAPPNAGLACFAIGLRSRDVRTSSKVTRGLFYDGAPEDFAPVKPATPSPSLLCESLGTGATAGRAPTTRTDSSRVQPYPSAIPATPNRSTRQAADGALIHGAHPTLISPSRFSSPDSEALSSPDSTAASSTAAGDCWAGRGSARSRPPPPPPPPLSATTTVSKTMHEDHTGMLLSRATTATMPSAIGHESTMLTRRVASGEETQGVVAQPPGFGELFTSAEITQELQTRKDLLRMVALRRLICITHKPQFQVMDVELPPPHGKIRARYGMCKETRATADLFYR